MPKRATAVILSEKEQEGLLQITKRHRSEQQAVLRARIVLAAAHRSSNVQIARDLHINGDTVRLWRGPLGGVDGVDPESVRLVGRVPEVTQPGGTTRAMPAGNAH